MGHDVVITLDEGVRACCTFCSTPQESQMKRSRSKVRSVLTAPVTVMTTST